MTRAKTDGELNLTHGHQSAPADLGETADVVSLHRADAPDHAEISGKDRRSEDSTDGASTKASEGEINLRMMRTLIAYTREKSGEIAIQEMVNAAGLGPGDLEKEDLWVSVQQFESVLATARAHMNNDQEFLLGCGHDMARLYGPLFLVVRAASLQTAFKQMARTTHLVSRVSQMETKTSPHRNAITLTYRSSVPESRLMCLSRQGQWRALPTTLWGLPPAIITEESCIGRGDSSCRYQIRWREPFRWRKGILGFLLGGGASWALSVITLSPIPLVVPPLMGLVGGLMHELRRSRIDENRFAQEAAVEVEKLLESHVQATTELLALHHRQNQWTGILEQQVADRTSALESVAKRIRRLRQEDHTALRDLSHDFRNPLTVIRGNVSLMLEDVREPASDSHTAHTVHTLRNLDLAVDRLDALLRDLTDIATSAAAESGREPAPQPIQVDAMAERFKRQLEALVLGRDLRISVFRTREAPDQVVTHAPVFDRVMDNILTNAAKYTERGSIVVEITGTPQTLCIKVSDTGRGISPQRLERTFREAQPDPNPMIGSSHGIGLSVVVRLLDRLGGKLEVMSRESIGSTFWVYLPEEPPDTTTRSSSEPLDSLLARVVKIRPANDND